MRARVLDRSSVSKRLNTEFFHGPLLENNLRGYWCEAMVAEALGEQAQIVSFGWYPWDIQIGPDTGAFPERIRIQVKNSARVQTWHREGDSKSSSQFNLPYRRKPSYFDRDMPDVPCEDVGFLCDIFVLCFHPVEDIALADHTNTGQWEFFLVPVAGPNMGITDAELDYARAQIEKGQNRSNCIRRPTTLPLSIRGRPAIPRISISELRISAVRKALGLPGF